MARRDDKVGALIAHFYLTIESRADTLSQAAPMKGDVMGRSLAILRLGSIAALIFALTAPAALAAPKLTSAAGKYPMGLAGSEVGKHKFTLPGSRTFECTALGFEGFVKSKSEAETSKVTVEPTFSEGCTGVILGNVVPITVELNGCTQQLSFTEAASGKPKEEGYEYTGRTTLSCPESKTVELRVWESESKHLKKEGTICTYTIGSQGPLSSMDYKLEGSGKEGTFNETGSGIAVTRTSGTLTNCGAASQTATYEGKTHVEALNSSFELMEMSFDP